MILVVLMVAGMLPVEQMATVVATDFIPAGTIIYFQPSDTWKKDGAIFGFVSTANKKNSEVVVMSKVDGAEEDIYKGALTAEASNIQFLRLNPAEDPNYTYVQSDNKIEGNGLWNYTTSWPELESSKKCM